jgi:UDP-N-acetylmuramyl tripeptide synthase
VLEVLAASGAQCRAWEERVRAMRQALGWRDDAIVASVYASGASLAFAAAQDQLFTATEVNEWAWQGAAYESLQLPLPNAPGYPATWDFAAAESTLRKLAAAEACPSAMAVIDAAAQRGLPAFFDEEALSLGAGEGSRTWLLADVPDNAASVDWSAISDIPTALVTGSNGKTTTVRLVAAMCAGSGLSAGFNCTDGIFIAGEQVEKGDYSGPAGARQVLREHRVQAAILETARGGILRRGLAVNHADAAIITNISPDHFGEYGMHDLSDLADAKLVVARAIHADGVLVLNADDEMLLAKSSRLDCPLAWFSLDDAHPRLRAHRRLAGATCGVADGWLWLNLHGTTHRLGEVATMPLTLGGSARYNIANIAGAALLAASLGVAPLAIAAVLAVFGSTRLDNPGRLERWRIHGINVLLDYAHNPEGLAGLLDVARGIKQGSGGRMGLLLGQAGNRDDEAIRALARTAAAARPDFVVLKDLEGYMRGRTAGEVPEILRTELLRQGISETSLVTVLPEVEAAQAMLVWARPDDVVVLPVHNLAARDVLVRWLDAQGAETP